MLKKYSVRAGKTKVRGSFSIFEPFSIKFPWQVHHSS